MGNGRFGWAGGSTGVARLGSRIPIGLAAFVAFLITLAIGPAPAPAQETNRVMIYTGTTGFRHTDAINNGRPVVQAALEDAGYTVDWEDCNGFGTAAGQCQNADENPRVFSDANLANYDAILFLNASDFFSGTGGNPGQLFGATNTTESTPQREAIIDFVRNGGGIAAVHNFTDAGAGQTTWDWWDANNGNSVVGSTMRGHAATDLNNVAQVQVADRNHLSTRDLPSTYGFGDEHYNFNRSVRGDHHVLETLDERTYNPGGNAMGYDHPITWCKLYDGDNVNDATGEPKSYSDGRTWITGMGHFGSSYTENGGDNNLVKTIVGGVRWAAGEGLKSDCSGTVWSSFQRTILVPDANAPIGLDVAPDGKVYWSEIGTGGSYPNFTSTGSIMMHDPSGPAGNKTTVATIETRADHSNSEDGVLGMALSPSFATDRNVFVYYSPRNPAWPTSGNEYTVGYNVISRFTLNAEGDAVVPGSERQILRVPKVKLAGNPTWCTGCPSGNGPGHVGGAGLDFDSEGNLYLGVGDDVSPNESGHNAYPPLDYRAQEHRDARKTAANTGDLRGKVVRIQPFLGEIPADTEPGVGQTYAIPEGNMFAPGTENARPEIYAMGFRQPFTLHTDPAQPGVVGVGEFCHDNSANDDDRAPAGTCEWNLLDEPGFQGWPFCVGNNSAANSSFRWDYQANASTNERYDCSLDQIPSDLDYAPAGQSNPGPTNPGLANIPGPANPATIWKKYPGAANGQSALDFGDLGPGGQQPVAGPIYRFDPAAGPNAFPRYYDGSWFILNRGGPGGFWKEVRRTDDGELLKVNDWIPDNAFGDPATSQVIGTQFGPDGALYAARFPVGCCRNNTDPTNQVQIVKFDFSVQDECLEDLLPPNTSHEVEGQAHPTEPDTFVIGGLRDSADLRITANDQGCAGVDHIEYREAGTTEWTTYDGPVVFDTAGDYEIEYRAIDRSDNASEIETASFSVVDANDTTPPAVEASLSGSQNEDGDYVGSAELDLEATDEISGIDSIEYRVNSDATEDWQAAEFDGSNLSEATEVEFDEAGTYDVDYRATDTSGNTSVEEAVQFDVVEQQGCVPALSDEFEGSALDPKWNARVEAGDFSVDDGQLVLPILDEIDGTRTGPLSFVSQPVPDGDWSLTTRVTPDLNTSWAQAGIMLRQSDGNFVKFVFGRDANSGDRRVEMASDNPTDTREVGPSVAVPNTTESVWLRLFREGNTIGGEYALDDAGEPGEWVEHPGTRAVDTTPPREGEGVQIGLYGGSDIEAAPYDQQARFEFARFEPDQQTCGNCLRSDEFDGAALDARWLRHTRNNGTPTEGPMAPTLADGQLLLPTNDFELDGASGTTSVGPVNFIGQDLNALGDDWEVETQFTIAHNGGWQNVGLAVWNGDNNFFRSSITNSLTASQRTIYIEQSKDNPTTTEGARVQAGGNVNALVGQPITPVTIKMRYARVDGADSVTGQYQITAPESIAMDDWADFPATNSGWTNSGGLDLNPAGGPRRDAPGSRIGIIAGSNFPGSSGNFPYGGTPAVAEVDYFRVTPDECSEEDTEAPTTTAALDPAEPGPGGTYDEPVTVVLSATDNEGGSGVETTHYRIDGGEWQLYDLLMPPTISEPGAHTVDFYSVDTAGNQEDPPGSVSFTIAGGGDDTNPPVTEATTDPAGPGPHDGPVDVTLSATDPDEGTEPANHDVFASGTSWNPDQVDLAEGDDVTWHFDEPDAQFPHDVWLVPPGGDPDPDGGDITQVTDGPVSPGGEPVSETFGQVGSWEYICRLHSGFSGGEWVGMVGDANVAEGGGTAGSGVASTTYSIDGGSDVVVENTNADDPFETTFTVSEPGEHTITYFSTDNAGNAEEEKTVTFTIEEEEPGGPELDLSVKPRRQTVKARDKAKFTATLTNLGDEAAADVELCAKAPKRLVEVKGKECATASSLEPDADMAPEFTFKPTNKARGKKVEITFTANSSNADPATATAELKVRSKR